MAYKVITLLAILCIAGCATKHEDHYTAPSSVEVQRNIARIAPHVRPEGKAAYADLQKSLADYQEKVDQQGQLLFKAQESADYWHQKQIKALKELWIWRSIAIVSVLCVVAYIGIKTSWRFLL